MNHQQNNCDGIEVVVYDADNSRTVIREIWVNGSLYERSVRWPGWEFPDPLQLALDNGWVKRKDKVTVKHLNLNRI